jgi:Spy/CpxP family protein refolding chaperone
MSETPRKSRRKILIATLVGVPLALLLGAGFLHAQHFVQHHAHSAPAAPLIHSEHVHAMLAKVGASADQQARIDGFLQIATEEMQAAQDRLGKAHRELAEMLLAPTVDQGQIEILRTGQMLALDATSQRLVAVIRDAVLVLTPEQRATLLGLHHPNGG